MRKRNVNNFFDTLFWYLIYFFPVLAYLINLSVTGVTSFSTFIDTLGFAFTENNLIMQGFVDLFGVNGILPLFTSNTVFYIFTWFVLAIYIHLVVDFLVFIGRLAHKWFNAFTTRD